MVTNAKFADRFRDFATSWVGSFELTVVDDGTTSDDDKLGAIGDLAMVIRQEDIDEDLLLLVRIGLLVAPTTLPQVTRLVTGMDPEDPKFRRRWSKCLRAIAARIAADGSPMRHGQRKASELHEHVQ